MDVPAPEGSRSEAISRLWAALERSPEAPHLRRTCPAGPHLNTGPTLSRCSDAAFCAEAAAPRPRRAPRPQLEGGVASALRLPFAAAMRACCPVRSHGSPGRRTPRGTGTAAHGLRPVSAGASGHGCGAGTAPGGESRGDREPGSNPCSRTREAASLLEPSRDPALTWSLPLKMRVFSRHLGHQPGQASARPTHRCVPDGASEVPAAGAGREHGRAQRSRGQWLGTIGDTSI